MTTPAARLLAAAALLAGCAAPSPGEGGPASRPPAPTGDARPWPEVPPLEEPPLPPPEAPLDEAALDRFERAFEAERTRREASRLARETSHVDARTAALERTLGRRGASLEADDEPLAAILRRLEERHAVRLAVDEDGAAAVAAARISCSFRESTLARVVIILAALAGVEPVPEGDGVRFRALR